MDRFEGPTTLCHPQRVWMLVGEGRCWWLGVGSGMVGGWEVACAVILHVNGGESRRGRGPGAACNRIWGEYHTIGAGTGPYYC